MTTLATTDKGIDVAGVKKGLKKTKEVKVKKNDLEKTRQREGAGERGSSEILC